MKRLLLVTATVLAWLVPLALIYAASVYTYGRYFYESQSQLPGWPDTSEFGDPVEWQTKDARKVRILAMNGGALYGLSELEVLKAIEARSGKPIYELFDFVAGSSTGAVIAALLFSPSQDDGPPLSAEKVLEGYEEFATEILGVPLYHRILSGHGLFSPVIPNEGRIQVFKETFGDRTFNELLRPAMFPSFSQKENGLRVFRNWDKVEGNVYLRSLVTAVTSAPIYFPAITFSGEHASGEFIGDAAMILNAPGEIAYLHARTHLPEHQEFIVVSLGSKLEQPVSTETAEGGGLIKWFFPLMRMVFSGEATVSSHALDRHADFESSIEIKSYFLSPNTVKGVNGFNPKPENIAKIRASGQSYVAQNSDLIDEVVGVLMDTPN